MRPALKLSLPFLLAAAMCITAPCTARAEDSPWTVDLKSAFLTDYMFRGFNLYDGATIQPSAGLIRDLGEWGKLGGTVWAHLSAEGGKSPSPKFTEIDYTLKYDIAVGPVGLSLGHIWYTYPSDADIFLDTEEFFASAVVNTLLSPTLSVYDDYSEFDALYFELGFSHLVETSALGEGFNMTPFVVFGFASDAEKVYADDGFVQATMGVSFNATIGDIVVSPGLNFTAEDDDLLDNEFWSGVTFAYSL